MTLTDDDTGSASASTTTTVNNVAPFLLLDPVTAISEDGVATLTGTITDPGTLDTFTLDIDWGDPLSPGNTEQVTFPAGTTTFSLTHQYPEAATSAAADAYTVSLALTDDDSGAVPGRLVIKRQAEGRSQVISDDAVELPPGKQVFAVQQELDASGFYQYEAEFIPQREEDDTTQQNNQATTFAHVRGKGKVLVIEDDDAIRLAAREALELSGYSVIATANMTDAIRRLGDAPRPIALVLADVVTPGMNARDLLYRLAELDPRPRILFMSGNARDELVDRGLLEPNAPFVHKPFGIQELLAAVRRELDRQD